MESGSVPSHPKPTKTQLLAGAVFAVCVLVVGLIIAHQVAMIRGSGMTYFVSPAGTDSNTGTDDSQPFHSIRKALERAQPGDRVQLADGSYPESIATVRSGRKGAPITIQGSKKAVVTGSQSRVVEIHHDYISLIGFRINGQIGPGTAKKDFRDKLVYVIGKTPRRGVEHLTIDNMLIENAGGECIRLRYFARHNEISNTTVRNCGVYDFRLQDGGKNGEGIYIGTAPEQRKDGKNPTSDPDESRHNYIHHNTIETNGNECVDIKEAATQNLVEYNTCSKQKDPESAGLDARGNHNTFRHNRVFDTVGAAVRLGGDTENDGTQNDVYDNIFFQNQAGPLMIRRLPQGKICNNSVDDASRITSDDTGIDPRVRCE